MKTYCTEKYSCRVIEGTINEPVENIFERISKENPDIIGLSCYIWNINHVIILGEMLRKSFPESAIVLGGPEVSYNPKEILEKYSWCDYIVSGEGEYPFAMLCDSLMEKNESCIPGVCCRRNGEIIISDPYIGKGEPPSPYCEEFFENLHGRIAYLETSRGCPYSCAFCLSGRCGGVRFFDIERAKKEMLLLAESGTRTVKLVDRTFNANKQRAKELWRFVINEHGKGIPENVCFHFEIAGDNLDDESIEILNSAPKGSIQLEIGMQSFNEKTLAYIKRRTDTKKLVENIKKLLAPGNLHIHIDLIAGLPFEDIKSFEHSFDIGYNLRSNMLQLGFLKLLHGAQMREDKEKYPCVFSKEPPYEVISTEWTDENDLLLLHKVEDALERLCNSGRFIGTVDYVIEKTGFTPFEFFKKFGVYAAEHSKPLVSLDDYTEMAFLFLSGLEGIEPSVLKDRMICDRLCSNSSGKLPEVLKVRNPEIKKIRNEIESLDGNGRKPGIKRGFSLLESERAAVFADYTNKDPVTGKYMLKKVYY